MKTWFSKIDCGTFSILLLLRPLHKMRAMVAALTGVEKPGGERGFHPRLSVIVDGLAAIAR
jgi:hypothetical protein